MSYHKDNRILPQAVEVEQAVLGAMLFDEEAAHIAMQLLSSDDFSETDHQHIYLAIVELSVRNAPFDILSIEVCLRNKNVLEVCGGSDYLAELLRSVGSPANIEYHAQILREKSAKRKLILACAEIVDQAYDPSSDTYQVLDLAGRKVFDLTHLEDRNTTREASRYIGEAVEHLKSIQGAKNGITGIGTGLDIDKLTAGWQNGEFIVLAARPSMGKTAFALQSMKYAAQHYGAAGLISLEMSGRVLGMRMLISEAGIDSQKARTGKLSRDELQQIERVAEELKRLGLLIDDTTFVSAQGLRAKARALIHKYRIKVLAVDYVQLLTSGKDNREQQVAEISRTCKAIAKECNIPVIGLSQLNRSCETRVGINKRPQLSDLRESGAIEQDADVVGFLFRPAYYGITNYPQLESEGRWQGSPTGSICELIIAKQRNGPTGTIRLCYDQASMRFDNLGGSCKKQTFVSTSMNERDDLPF